MKNKKKISLILTSLALSVSAFAAKIDKIELKNLNTLNQTEVLKDLGISEGTEFTDKTEQEIYAKLMSTRLFSNVTVKPNKKLFGNINLVIEVEEASNIQEVLQQRAILVELSKRTDLIVNSVKIKGTKFVDIDAIVSNANIKKGEAFVPIHVNELAGAIFSTGYFREVVPEVNRDAKGKYVDVVINVVENPVIKSVNLQGITVFNQRELLEATGLQVGKVFNANLLNPETSSLIQAYVKNGIITARIEEANVTDAGNVNIVISEGIISSVNFKKKYATQDNKRLSEKNIELKTKEYVFERMNYLKEGNILTEKALKRTVEEMFRTGLFDLVEPVIEADETNINGRKITLLVSERPTMSINGNVSYETKEGFTGGVTFADKNLLGRNQDLSLQASFGTRGNYEFSISYFDPWIKNTNRLQLGVSTFFKREKSRKSDLLKNGKYKFIGEKTTTDDVPYQVLNILRDSGSYIYGGALTLGKGFNNNTFLSFKPRLYGVRTTNAEHINKDNNKVAVKPFVDYTLGSITLGVSYDTRNDIAVPKTGLYLNTNYEVGYIFREKSLTNKALTILNKDIKDYNTSLMADAEVSEALEKLKEARNDKKTSKEVLKEKEDAYNTAVEKYIEGHTLPSLNDAKYAETLKARPYQILNIDARAYHRVYKEWNSMAYRLTFGYASKGTPENMLFSTYNGGTTLRGYNDERSSIMLMGTVENRTYINNYAQIVLFAEAGVNNKKTDDFYDQGKYVGLPIYQGFKETFSKANVKADVGLGVRLNTPLGVIRLDYAWPLVNTDQQSKKGKFSFGFGQTF